MMTSFMLMFPQNPTRESDPARHFGRVAHRHNACGASGRYSAIWRLAGRGSHGSPSSAPHWPGRAVVVPQDLEPRTCGTSHRRSAKDELENHCRSGTNRTPICWSQASRYTISLHSVTRELLSVDLPVIETGPHTLQEWRATSATQAHGHPGAIQGGTSAGMAACRMMLTLWT